MTSVHTAETQSATSPDEAVAMLAAGNDRFAAGQTDERVLLEQVRATANGQHPVVAIVSCIDSRVPPELVFDLGIGDAFVLRSAGNVVDDDVLGGLEFAVAVAGVKAVVVLGHTACGAVKGACDGVELGHLTGLLAKVRPAIDAVSGAGELPGSDDPAVVSAVVEANIAESAVTITRRSEILAARVASGELALAQAVYDITSGRVTWLESS